MRSGRLRARAVVGVDDVWYASVVEFSESLIPASVHAQLDAAGSAAQRVVLNGDPYLVIGVQLPGVEARYVEFVPLAEYARTMETLGAALAVGAATATAGGAAVGWLLSWRVLQPLADVSYAAAAIASGDLGRRLEVGDDRDLEPVAASFNEMARSLEERIAREVRFTSDVSHELRTAHRHGVGGESRQTCRARRPGSICSQCARRTGGAPSSAFTLELLEISRIDAGAANLDLSEVDVYEVVRRVLRQSGTCRRPGSGRVFRLVHCTHSMKCDSSVCSPISSRTPSDTALE